MLSSNRTGVSVLAVMVSGVSANILTMWLCMETLEAERVLVDPSSGVTRSSGWSTVVAQVGQRRLNRLVEDGERGESAGQQLEAGREVAR